MTKTHAAQNDNLQGDALKVQRFQMLTDIAAELQEKVVFPVNIDVTMNIRSALQKNSPREHLRQLIHLDPVVGAKLLRMANRRAKRHKQPSVNNLKKAFELLDDDTIRQAATDISMPQVLRARFLADFSDWTDLLWERTLNMAATAQVLARKFTDIDPEHAMFAALCHDMSLYYMLYRAVQYPELRARPASLKHLVINWHAGIAESLFTALKLPQEIIEAIAHDGASAPSTHPKTLADIIRISNELSGPLGDSGEPHHHSTLHVHYQDDQEEIQACRRDLYALFG
jgi:HD-like signal output (HDOD) protein